MVDQRGQTGDPHTPTGLKHQPGADRYHAKKGHEAADQQNQAAADAPPAAANENQEKIRVAAATRVC